ncbi:hypothetical protein BC629DRAFT_1590794 [Irpex lacteus]|nr:hypothetical protein BC629DRAFT_1590794 [Irpex lacteus]
MSNATQVSAADIAELELFTTGLHVLVACIALYCYEWFITLDQEINDVWAKGWSLATWVFAANRYGTLLIMIIQILPTPNRTVRTYPYDNINMSLTIPEQSCVWEIYLGAVFEILQFIVVAVFTASRAYALCDRKLWVFLTVFGLCMAPFATNMVCGPRYGKGGISPDISKYCVQRGVSTVSDTGATGLIDVVELSTRLTVIAADIIVLVVTWRKVPLDFRALWRRDLHSPLLDFLIRDGK